MMSDLDEIIENLEESLHFIRVWFGVETRCEEAPFGDEVTVMGPPFLNKGGLVFSGYLEAATYFAGAVEVLKSFENNPGLYLTRLHAAQF